jgi:lipopolysaccharide export system permease protein
MKKLQNYIAREVMHTMLAMMLVLLGIMVSVMFIKYLSMAASGEMSLGNAMAMLGIVLPNFINLLIPVSLFLSLIITINRLLYDSELVSAFACGVSWFDLVKWLLLPGLILSLISLVLSFWVVPKMAYYQNNLLQISAQNADATSFLQTGRFFASGNNNQVVYVGSVDFKNGKSQDIFIYRKVGDNTEIILAPEGQITQKSKLSALSLLNGHEYQGVLGTLAYQMASFKTFDLLMIPVYNTVYADKSTFPMVLLLKDKDPPSILELEWRCSIPLATLILTFLGVMLGDPRPRKSKYLYFLMGTGIFIIYFNALSIARSLVMNNVLKLYPGLYLVHVIFFFIALLLLMKREMFFNLLRK